MRRLALECAAITGRGWRLGRVAAKVHPWEALIAEHFAGEQHVTPGTRAVTERERDCALKRQRAGLLVLPEPARAFCTARRR